MESQKGRLKSISRLFLSMLIQELDKQSAFVVLFYFEPRRPDVLVSVFT